MDNNRINNNSVSTKSLQNQNLNKNKNCSNNVKSLINSNLTENSNQVTSNNINSNNNKNIRLTNTSNIIKGFSSSQANIEDNEYSYEMTYILKNLKKSLKQIIQIQKELDSNPLKYKISIVIDVLTELFSFVTKMSIIEKQTSNQIDITGNNINNKHINIIEDIERQKESSTSNINDLQQEENTISESKVNEVLSAISISPDKRKRSHNRNMTTLNKKDINKSSLSILSEIKESKFKPKFINSLNKNDDQMYQFEEKQESFKKPSRLSSKKLDVLSHLDKEFEISNLKKDRDEILVDYKKLSEENSNLKEKITKFEKDCNELNKILSKRQDKVNLLFESLKKLNEEYDILALKYTKSDFNLKESNLKNEKLHNILINLKESLANKEMCNLRLYKKNDSLKSAIVMLRKENNIFSQKNYVKTEESEKNNQKYIDLMKNNEKLKQNQNLIKDNLNIMRKKLEKIENNSLNLNNLSFNNFKLERSINVIDTNINHSKIRSFSKEYLNTNKSISLKNSDFNLTTNTFKSFSKTNDKNHENDKKNKTKPNKSYINLKKSKLKI